MTISLAGLYYKMAGQEELDAFLAAPERYVAPLAPRQLPPPEMLPTRLRIGDPTKASLHLRGYCAVSFVDGDRRYEALVPGISEFAAEYRGRLYHFESEEKVDKFMRWASITVCFITTTNCKETLPH